MAKETEILKTSEKLETSELFTYSEAVKQLATQKKAEFEDYQHKISLAKATLRSLQDSLSKTQADFNTKMTLEKQKFDGDCQNKTNELLNRDENLRNGERNLIHREMLIKERELKMNLVDEERKQLFQERVEIEKLKNATQIELKNTMALQGEAQNKVNQANTRETEANKILKEANEKNSLVEYKLGQLKEKEKKILTDIENLEKIRQEIKPQLEESEKAKIQNEAILEEVKERENSINSKIEEDRRLLREASATMDFNKNKEIELATKEEQLIRAELMNKDKK